MVKRNSFFIWALLEGKIRKKIDVTTGAQNDIAQASNLARRMVTEFGMSERLGAINYGSERSNPFGMPGAQRDVPVADETAREIDAEVKRMAEQMDNQAPPPSAKARFKVADSRPPISARVRRRCSPPSLQAKVK